MGAQTEIAWTDHTFNPWWGCTRVSAGCEHCYAESMARRWGHGWGPGVARRTFGAAHWDEPLRWARDAAHAGCRRRVFCASMADWLEDRRDLDDERTRLRMLIEATPELDWQLLTKRPENAVRLSPWEQGPYPLHVWLGTTVEHAGTALRRLDALCDLDAAVRFVSCEPLLGPVDLRPWLSRLHWVIVGGESGPGRREMDLGAAEHIVRDCLDAGVAVFVKQDSAAKTGQQGRIPDAWWIRQMPVDASPLAVKSS